LSIIFRLYKIFARFFRFQAIIPSKKRMFSKKITKFAPDLQINVKAKATSGNSPAHHYPRITKKEFFAL